jgi:hypothetical protein
MTNTYGDYDTDDSYDTASADPEQVARKLHQLRQIEGREDFDWEDLDDSERGVRVLIMALLLAWGRRQGFVR